MIKELPTDARESSVEGAFITRDARVFKQYKTGFKEMKIRTNKNGTCSFYDSANKCYVSLVQEYADAFVENPERKPLAVIKDASKPLSEDNIFWATDQEVKDFIKANSKRYCRCCGSEIEKSVVGALCKACFAKNAAADDDPEETERFKNRVAATEFDPDKNRFSGRQRDMLEMFLSGIPIDRIAKVVGCDEQTAKACIRSANQARLLEKMSSECVTEIGYKTPADVLPAKRGSESESKPSPKLLEKVSHVTKSTIRKSTVSENKEQPTILQSIFINCELKEPRVASSKVGGFSSGYCSFVDGIVNQLKYSTVQDALTNYDYFEEPCVHEPVLSNFSSGYLAFVADIVSRLTYRPVQDALTNDDYFSEPRVQEMPSVEPVKPSVHRHAQRVHGGRRAGKRTIFIPDGPMFDSRETVSMAACVDCKPTMPLVPVTQDRASLDLTPIVCNESVPEPVCATGAVSEPACVSKASVTIIPEPKELIGMADLFDAYKRSHYSIGFATFCKVYWIACKYSVRHSLHLTRLTIAGMLNHNISFDTQNINMVLKLGMEVIDGR